MRLSLLKSRRGAAASASAGPKRSRSGLRGSMEKDSKKGVTHEFKALHAAEGDTTTSRSPPI